MKKSIAVIFGGEGLERSISELSASTIISFIDKKLYTPVLIGITSSGCWYIYRGSPEAVEKGTWSENPRYLTPTFPVTVDGVSGFLCGNEILRVDAAVIILHGERGEDGIIQGALDAAHIPYVGADVYASAVTADKAYTKLCAEHLSIPTAKWLLSTKESENDARVRAEEEIGYPMFIKPARRGSSFGAHPVLGSADFSPAFSDAFTQGGGRVLIEALIPVDYELECGYLEGESPMFSPKGRILSDGNFYDFDAKYKGRNSPALELCKDNTEGIQYKAEKYAKLLVDFIGIRHMSRIDFFVTKNGELLFNEINSIPGMTKSSLYPKLTETMGFGRGEFINRLIEAVCKK